MVALALLTVGTTGSAATPTLDLRHDSDLKVVGGCSKSMPAGDANGDGTQDVVVWRCGLGPQSMVVIFGPFSEGDIDIANLPNGGYEIVGPGDEAQLTSFDSADVNGDGRGDVLIGYPGADSGSGRVYVVFGKSSSDTVELAAFDGGMQGAQGYRIDGTGGFEGETLAGSPDMNGDGFDEIIVGAPFAGTTYVVFGKNDTLPVDLQLFQLGLQGEGGFVIHTPGPDRDSGYSVGAAGDVNADGVPDVVVGVIPRTHGSPGSAFVVFAEDSPDPVDVTQESFRGFRIQGAQKLDATGHSVDGAGDVNGDGRDDVIVGAPQENYHGRGHAYVVFGKTGRRTVLAADLGGDGYKITGRKDSYLDNGWESAGSAVAGAGDIDGDGLADVIVGAKWHDYKGRNSAGATYVAYGKRSSTTIKLRRLGLRGYRIVGEGVGHNTGAYVAGGGDINGDGIPDVMIGNNTGRPPHIVWGRRWN